MTWLQPLAGIGTLLAGVAAVLAVGVATVPGTARPARVRVAQTRDDAKSPKRRKLT